MLACGMNKSVNCLNLRRQDAESEPLQLLWTNLIASVGLTSHVSTHILEEMRAVEAVTPDTTSFEDAVWNPAVDG